MSALERVWKAATTACDASDLHRRVEYAVTEVTIVMERDYPPELVPLWQSIVGRCTKHGNIPDSVRRLSEREAARCST